MPKYSWRVHGCRSSVVPFALAFALVAGPRAGGAGGGPAARRRNASSRWTRPSAWSRTAPWRSRASGSSPSGRRASFAAASPPARTIDTTGQIVMPGLVNTHTHVPMTLFRGVADDVELWVWLTKFIWPAEAAARDAGVRDLGHAARGLGDDPDRHHHLRRHVLLRGPGGGGREAGRAARLLRGDGVGPEGAGARGRRGRPARRRGLPEEVVGRPVDRAGARAARRVHGEPGDAATRQGARRPLQGAAHDPRGREPERDEDDPREVRDRPRSRTSTGSASWVRT